jgi:NitT/TauT family transport system substrate-binding protein
MNRTNRRQNSSTAALATTLLAFAALFAGAGCGDGAKEAAPSANPSPTSRPAATPPAGLTADGKVELLLNWFPEAEHGGFYAAEVLGLYQKSGIGVKIRPGGPEVPVLPFVAREGIRFGVANADEVLIARAQGVPVVALMAPLQQSPRCVMVHDESPIQSFDDLKNVTLSISPGAPFTLFLEKKFALEGVRQVPYGGNVTQFLLEKEFAQQGYVFSEPFVAEQKGGKTRSLMAYDAGFNPYTSVLVTNEETVANFPELARAVTQASVDGWVAYLADPAATNEHIQKQNPEMGAEILAFGVEALKPLAASPDVEAAGFGTMTLERWSALLATLEEIGVVKPGATKAEEAFTTEFLGAR